MALVLLTGLLTAESTAAQETLLGVHGGSLSQTSNNPGAISRINQDTASLTVLATPIPGVGLTGVATNSAGRVFASTATVDAVQSGPRLLEIHPVTGELLNDVGRMRSASGEDCYVSDLSFQPGTDILYGILTGAGEGDCGTIDDVWGRLVTIDTVTAVATVLGEEHGQRRGFGGIAFAADGTLYYTPCWQIDGELWTLDPATGEMLTSTAMEPGTCYMGLAVRPSDGKLFGSYNWENDGHVLVTLDPTTGAATMVGGTGFEMIHDLTFTNGQQGIVINQGMTDAWFNDATPGQGFLIVVLPDTGIIFLAWFTYEIDRPDNLYEALLGEIGHRWVTAQGPYDGDTANLTVYLTEGGVFDAADPPAVTDVDNPIGTITIVWHDCSSATLMYIIDPPGVMGQIPLRRIVPDNEVLCEALMEP